METERTIKLIVAYDGTRFKGWQRGNGRTVQGELEKALAAAVGPASRGAARIANVDGLRIAGAGRTDAGVHAEGQVASAAVPLAVEPGALLAEVNSLLPDDLAVLSCEAADPRFHARYRAKAKTYRYRIVDGPVGDPFLYRYSFRVSRRLDEARVAAAARAFEGTYDCASLTADKSKKDKTRTVSSVAVERRGRVLDLSFTADGFLWNQVRIMASLLIAAGKGEAEAASIRALLAARDRSAAPPPAPACGLCLVSVDY